MTASLLTCHFENHGWWQDLKSKSHPDSKSGWLLAFAKFQKLLVV